MIILNSHPLILRPSMVSSTSQGRLFPIKVLAFGPLVHPMAVSRTRGPFPRKPFES